MMVDLFVGFRANDSDDNIISIKLRSHIKFIFVNMLYQIYNFRCFRHLMIINYVGLQPFIFTINPLMFLIL